MNTINLTQHMATQEQLEVGVFEPDDKEYVKELLTFDSIPSRALMVRNAFGLAAIAKNSGAKYAMIGGAPFFMSTLEEQLIASGVTPVYAFSTRESIDKVNNDGSLTKVAVFRHTGFVEVVKGNNDDD